MTNLATDFPMTRYLVEQDVFENDSFVLIDVGCEGGIHKRWHVFGKQLKAYGADPLVHEIERLRREETNSNVSYSSGFIGLPAEHPVMVSRGGKQPWGNNPWSRLSAAWAAEIRASRDPASEGDVLERTLAESSNRIRLTEFVRDRIDSVDFVKVDVDGEDLYVLLSGEDILRDDQMLGLEVEVNFFGTACETDNTFHNIDRLMRAHGYELFDLTVKRYSRRAMPAPFVYDLVAEAKWGAPVQGDAFYARDLVGQASRSPSFSMSNGKLLKMAAVHELFGLPDCAAEILIAFKERLGELVDVAHLLDMLTPPFNGHAIRYQQYCGIFAEDPTEFYPTQAEVPQPQSPNRFSFRSKLRRVLRQLSDF